MHILPITHIRTVRMTPSIAQITTKSLPVTFNQLAADGAWKLPQWLFSPVDPTRSSSGSRHLYACTRIPYFVLCVYLLQLYLFIVPVFFFLF